MATQRNIDFTQVKDGGNFNKRRLPAGDYLATVAKVEDAESKADGVFQYLFHIKIDSHPSRVYPYYCKLQANQLWKLRNIAIAAGITIPKRKVKFDPNRIVGRKIGVTLEDDEYEGNEQSTVAGVYPAAELADGNLVADNEDDTDTDDIDDNLDDDLDDDLDDVDNSNSKADIIAAMDRAELKAALKKADPTFRAKTSQSDDDLRNMLREAQGSDDEEDPDDEEDEEPAPAPKKPAARTRTRRAAKVNTEEVTDDELDELDIDDI